MYKKSVQGWLKHLDFMIFLRRSMSMDLFYACIQYATWVA